MADEPCLFCRVVEGKLPAQVVAGNERALAFSDIDPKAPMHVLVVPRQHHPDVRSLADDPQALADVVSLAGEVAEREGVDGFRLVFNTGAGAGQSVLHAHGHVLAGRPLSWPPG